MPDDGDMSSVQSVELIVIDLHQKH